MAGSGTGTGGGSGGGGSSNPLPQAPKILLAKPALVTANKFNRGGSSGGDDDSALLRSRLPSVGSLNLLSDSWDFHSDRFLPIYQEASRVVDLLSHAGLDWGEGIGILDEPRDSILAMLQQDRNGQRWSRQFLTDNTDFTVIGVIGAAGVGKSTIMNEIYGFDVSSPGMLPPFAIESEETRANARHCTVGIEPRISAERIILLDTQPVFSPSVLAEMIRPDGSSTVSVLGGESLSAELAHEVMGIQLGVLLASICHIVLVVSEGVHDLNMWHLMLTVDLLKHSIPDPSSITLSHPQSSNMGSDKESKDKIQEVGEDYMAAPVFVHTKLQGQDLAPHHFGQLKKALNQYFSSSSITKCKSTAKVHLISSGCPAGMNDDCPGSMPLKSFLVPLQNNDDPPRANYESYRSMLWKLRDQVLSMDGPSFSRTVSERDWLRNSAKIWDLVKNSSTIAEYTKTLQSSGMFRK